MIDGFRNGIWMRYNADGEMVVVGVVDLVEDYKFYWEKGWVESPRQIPELGFSDEWNKYSVQEMISLFRKDPDWNEEYEKKFLDFPEGFIVESGKKKESSPKIKIYDKKYLTSRLKATATRLKMKLPEDATLLDFENMKGRIREAYEIAKKAHAGQKDKAGADYILHPMKVASSVGSDERLIVLALLHDVVEDTDVTMDDLSKLLGKKERRSLRALTHKDDMSYGNYIEVIYHYPLATCVKVVDLMHNADLRRIPNPTDKDIDRVWKYICALRILAFNSPKTLNELMLERSRAL